MKLLHSQWFQFCQKDLKNMKQDFEVLTNLEDYDEFAKYMISRYPDDENNRIDEAVVQLAETNKPEALKKFRELLQQKIKVND